MIHETNSLPFLLVNVNHENSTQYELGLPGTRSFKFRVPKPRLTKIAFF